MDRDTCEHFTPAGLPCAECVDLKSCTCSDCNQEVLQLRDELAQANGYLNRLCDMNRYLERLLTDARPCIDPARAGHSIHLGTRDACNCILCELVSRERQQKAALTQEQR